MRDAEDVVRGGYRRCGEKQVEPGFIFTGELTRFPDLLGNSM